MNNSVLPEVFSAFLPPVQISEKYSSYFSKSFRIAACIAPFLALSPALHAQATNLGNVNIGSASAATAVSVTFTQPDTLASIAVLTEGVPGAEFTNAGSSTCSTGTSYNVGDTCTVNVAFTPQFAGIVNGAVVLSDGSGNVIGNSYVYATGVGAQSKFMPGTETLISADVNGPEAITSDAAGNLYIPDSGNNRVLKETLSEGSYTESVIPTSPLNWPAAVAVDGSGNLYIADSFNSRIIEETPNGSGYTETTISTSPLLYPWGITVDQAGNLYIADTFNNRILKETLSGGSYTESTIPTSALDLPVSLALDASGNVYICDNGDSRILKETLSGGNYTETTIPTSPLMYPSTVTVDAAGTVYIVDTNNDRVVAETPAGTSYTETVIPTGSPLSYPAGVALDGGGNVFIADQFNNRVIKEDFVDAPALTFASTAEGAVNPTPQVVTVENAGNATLNFSGVSFAADFPELSTANADCTATTTLASGSTCSLSITFAPNAALNGNPSVQLTEGVGITTNTLNVPATQQTLTVTGTEVQP